MISCPVRGLIFVYYTCSKIHSERKLFELRISSLSEGNQETYVKFVSFFVDDIVFQDLQTEVCCLTLLSFKQVLPNRFLAGTFGPLYHNSCQILCKDNYPHILG